MSGSPIENIYLYSYFQLKDALLCFYYMHIRMNYNLKKNNIRIGDNFVVSQMKKLYKFKFKFWFSKFKLNYCYSDMKTQLEKSFSLSLENVTKIITI